jgi:hypothetical protein
LAMCMPWVFTTALLARMSSVESMLQHRKPSLGQLS